MHIFISYKHEDSDFAENVIHVLEKAGFQTWTDHKIRAGEEWRNEIDTAIKTSFALIVIMTPEAKISEYVTYEWAFALGVGIRVIPLMLNKSELHPRLEALQHLDFTNKNVRPWERLLEEIRAISHALMTHTIRIPPNVPPFVRQAVIALDSVSPAERKGAIETLRQAWKTADVYGVLIEALKHPIRDVRSNAAQALGQIKDTSAIPALLNAFHDPDPNVCYNAARALGQINDPSTIPTLTDALHDPEPYIRRNAAYALGEINNPSIVPALTDALYDDDPDVRSNAAYALGQSRDPSTIPALTNAALHDPDPNVRRNAVHTLCKINDPSIVPALTDAALHDPDSNVRRNAAYALGQINDPSTIPTLTDALHDPDPDVRSNAVKTFGEIRDPSAIPALTEATLHDPDSNVRRNAQYSLMYIERLKRFS